MTAPYIKTTLEDQSTRVVSTSGIYTGIVIPAKKGPVNKPTLVTSQSDLLRTFTPNEKIEIGYDISYYSAYYYLREGNKLWVVRACDEENALYGGCILRLDQNTHVSCSQGFKDPRDYGGSEVYQFGADDACLIYGSNVGAWNNDIGIKIITDQTKVKLEGAFIIEVYKNLSGTGTGTTGTKVETHLVSLNENLKTGYGTSCFIETVLEGSNYIRAEVNEAVLDAASDIVPKAQDSILKLAGGFDGYDTDASGADQTKGYRIKALNTLKSVNDIELSLIMDGGYTDPAYQKQMIALCQEREESTFAILSMPYDKSVSADKINAMTTYASSELNANSYLAALYAPHQKMYDEFNDKYIYVDPATFVAGRVSYVAENYGWHWPAAGYNRGIVNTLDAAATFTTGELDRLSEFQVNCLIKDPGTGIVIYDHLTTQSKASDLQEQSISIYLNVYLRPALKGMLKYYLFEFNDEQTRSAIESKVDVFMRSEKANRACYDYKVVCNEENNLPTDIENNRLNVWLYIKPTKAAKFIEQKIIITPYSVSLENIEIA